MTLGEGLYHPDNQVGVPYNDTPTVMMQARPRHDDCCGDSVRAHGFCAITFGSIWMRQMHETRLHVGAGIHVCIALFYHKMTKN